MLETQGQPQDPQESQKRRPGLGPGAGLGQGSGPLATSFLVPGDPKAAPGSPAYEYGSQVAILRNLSMVAILAKILMQIQNRHGHMILPEMKPRNIIVY